MERILRLVFVMVSIATVTLSCNNNKYEVSSYNLIEFVADDAIWTKGTAITNHIQMIVNGYIDNGSSMNAYFEDLNVTKSGDVWSSDKLVFWPINIGTKLNFYGYAPTATGDKGNGLTYTPPVGSTPPTITYKVPTDVKNQPDLIIATPHSHTIDGNTPPVVDLRMRHSLALISFKLASDEPITLTGINIDGARVKGTIFVDGSIATKWDLDNDSYTVSAGLKSPSIEITSTMNENIIASDGYLMMIPQTLGADAKINLMFSEIGVLSASLSGYEWKPNTKIIYLITITKNGEAVISIGEKPWLDIEGDLNNDVSIGGKPWLNIEGDLNNDVSIGGKPWK